jgi:PASTA domain-containing protein
MRQRDLTTIAPVGPSPEQSEPQLKATNSTDAADAVPGKLPVTGTVVLEVEQGGIEVPTFVGKTVRGAVETAEDVGLELEAVGSGLGRQQSPPAGTHVAAGTRVTVQFGR